MAAAAEVPHLLFMVTDVRESACLQVLFFFSIVRIWQRAVGTNQPTTVKFTFEQGTGREQRPLLSLLPLCENINCPSLPLSSQILSLEVGRGG